MGSQHMVFILPCQNSNSLTERKSEEEVEHPKIHLSWWNLQERDPKFIKTEVGVDFYVPSFTCKAKASRSFRLWCFLCQE